MSWCEDYIDPFPRECDHGVPDDIRCGECAAEMEDEAEGIHAADPDFNVGVYIDQD